MFYTLADACAPFGFGFAESPLRSEASSAHSTVIKTKVKQTAK